MDADSRQRNGASVIISATAFCSFVLQSPLASAQRADENVVTSAEEAFGFTLGGQAIGIYDSRNVRGFNPVQLGNVRMNGLYIDRQGDLTSQLIKSTSIQVGNSAINYPFPAPSGIADFKIRQTPAGDAYDSLSMTVGMGQMESPYFQSEFDHRFSRDVALLGGIGANPRENTAMDGHAEYYSAALALGTSLTPTIDLSVFANGVVDTRLYSDPVVYFSDRFLEARPRRLGQEWAEGEGYSGNVGAISRWKDDSGWSGALGLFYSNRTEDSAFDQVVEVQDNLGNATMTTFGVRNRGAESYSGEANASYAWASAIAQQVDFSVRARDLTRFAGNEALAGVEQANFYDVQPLPAADLVFDAANPKTDISQVTVGARYRATIREKLNASAGVQRSDYQLDFLSRDGTRTTTDSNTVLLNFDLAVPVGKSTLLYASYSEGLEEGGIAPADAANRYQVLPVLEAKQVDLGVRYSGDAVAIAVGVFQLEKPLAGIDELNVFRLVGDVESRGIELSVTTEPLPGLTLLAGMVALDPELTEEVGADTLTRRPVGLPRQRGRLDVDYAVPGVPGLSVDFSTTYIAETPMSRGNERVLPSTTVVDVGVRKALNLFGWPAAARLQVRNAANADNWRADSTGGLAYLPERTVTLAFTVSSR